jgi:hypothetical protein
MHRVVGVDSSAPDLSVQVDDSGNLVLAYYFYFGSPTSNGSWRLKVSGDDLIIERRESDAWVEKGRFQA